MKHIGRSFPETTPDITPETPAYDAALAAPDLESLTVNQLKELAAVEDIDLGTAKTKAEIIAIISAAKE